MAEVELSDASFDKEVLQAKEPVLVDLWAPWCGPCRMLAPIIAELAKEYAGKVKVAKLNTDEHTATPEKYRVSAIPTMLIFKDGKLVETLIGVQAKADIKAKLDGLLAA